MFYFTLLITLISINTSNEDILANLWNMWGGWELIRLHGVYIGLTYKTKTKSILIGSWFYFINILLQLPWRTPTVRYSCEPILNMRILGAYSLHGIIKTHITYKNEVHLPCLFHDLSILPRGDGWAHNLLTYFTSSQEYLHWTY